MIQYFGGENSQVFYIQGVVCVRIGALQGEKFQRPHAAIPCVAQALKGGKIFGEPALPNKPYVNDSVAEFVGDAVCEKSRKSMECL